MASSILKNSVALPAVAPFIGRGNGSMLARLPALVLAAAVFLAGCASGGGTRIDNIPMYGQPEIERPAVLKEADARFIKDASAGFASREAASVAWHQQGDEYMAVKNLDYAMRRYNQAWLLDPDSYLPYWGFARVMVAKREYEEAIKYFDEALARIDDPYQKPALLHDLAVAYNNKANRLPATERAARERNYSLANMRFQESTEADPDYMKAWRSWAFSLYFQGDYAAAWDKVKRARALDPDSIPGSFLSDLSAEMPEPKE